MKIIIEDFLEHPFLMGLGTSTSVNTTDPRRHTRTHTYIRRRVQYIRTYIRRHNTQRHRQQSPTLSLSKCLDLHVWMQTACKQEITNLLAIVHEDVLPFIKNRSRLARRFSRRPELTQQIWATTLETSWVITIKGSIMTWQRAKRIGKLFWMTEIRQK